MAIYLNPLKKILGLPQHHVTEITEDYQYVNTFFFLFSEHMVVQGHGIFKKKNLSKVLV